MTNTRGMMFSGAGEGAPSKAPRSLRIIVADDDRDTVLALSMLLREEGHEVRGVYKGFDVLNALRELNPDAVVLDLNMPDAKGYDIARRIRNRRGGEKMLLIAITGVYKKGADKIMAQMVGFDHYLTKLYEPSEVLRLLA